jgi:hypothetical protein
MRYQSALILLLLAAPPVAAQVTAEPLGTLRPGAHLRISLAGDLVKGRFASVTPSTLTLATDSGQRAIPLANITTVWERKRHGARGALIGGVIGAAAFTGFIHLMVSALCDSGDGCARDHRRAWGYGIVLGGAGGGLLGAGIGSMFTRWELVADHR